MHEFRQALYSTIAPCFDVLQFISTHAAVTLGMITQPEQDAGSRQVIGAVTSAPFRFLPQGWHK
jgi:hypothetical protein